MMCFCLLLLVSVRLAFSSCVTALFLLGLFWGLPRSHRLSSHSRLNAFVIQTKLISNVCFGTPNLWCQRVHEAQVHLPPPFSSAGLLAYQQHFSHILQCYTYADSSLFESDSKRRTTRVIIPQAFRSSIEACLSPGGPYQKGNSVLLFPLKVRFLHATYWPGKQYQGHSSTAWLVLLRGRDLLAQLSFEGGF